MQSKKKYESSLNDLGYKKLLVFGFTFKLW